MSQESYLGYTPRTPVFVRARSGQITEGVFLGGHRCKHDPAGDMFVRCTSRCCAAKPWVLKDEGGSVYNTTGFEGHGGQPQTKKAYKSIRVRQPPGSTPADISLREWKELASRERYTEQLVGSRIRVFWPKMRRFYPGMVASFSKRDGRHRIEYADGDTEYLYLAAEQFEFGWTVDEDRSQPLPGGRSDIGQRPSQPSAGVPSRRTAKATSAARDAAKQLRKLMRVDAAKTALPLAAKVENDVCQQQRGCGPEQTTGPPPNRPSEQQTDPNAATAKPPLRCVFAASNGRWKAKMVGMGANGETVWEELGRFDTEEEAAACYDAAMRAQDRERSRKRKLNFNEDSDGEPAASELPPGARSRPNPGVAATMHGGSAGPPIPAAQDLYLGMDFGTSGARAAVINGSCTQVAEARQSYAVNTTEEWERALWLLLEDLPAEVRAHTAAIAIAGTTTTCILTDARSGRPLAPAKLYSEAQAEEYVRLAAAIAPANHSATASISSLCKLLCWAHDPAFEQACSTAVVLSHADWMASLLHGRLDTTDAHNAVRLGYDAEQETFPAWLTSQPFAGLLPRRVVPPGHPVACVTPQTAERAGLPASCMVCAGTTDSVAAFMAAGVEQVGHAVTSLGSTLAIDLLSATRVDSAANGVTSYRLGRAWLVDGGSNTGGAVLRRYFNAQELEHLSRRIDPRQPSGMDYYPLLDPGQRFPICDPHLLPRMTPKPDDDVQFLQGLLEGIANIEAESFHMLATLGASPVLKVHTAGGGARNQAWTTIRQAAVGVPVVASLQAEAAFGAALLAQTWKRT
ncbi:hypothetical protein WJX72_011700 [[Myrmecia] bisecta]|uniref:AP2/ERF domain-containing protein n=1 Tax=[Myrmecia] bisecta TaxID=41462 RepID=A0AAW1P643_9CHLO